MNVGARLARGLAFALALLVPGLSGCDFARQRETLTRVAGCGAGAVEPAADLVRVPYVQSVTAGGAVVVWGTGDDAPSALAIPGMAPVTGAALARVRTDGDDYRLYAARVTGLAPSTAYCYAVVQGGATLIDGLGFKTAPAVTDAAVRFVVIGDYGAGTRAQLGVRARLEAQAPDLILTTGDNAYPDGSFEQFDKFVFAVYRALFARYPVFPTPGNHDYRTDDAGPYLANFVLPENAAAPPDRERYYSFDWGAVHFVALDTEAPLREASDARDDDMIDWLDKDLAAANRPWTVVYFHRPPYSTSRHEGSALVQREIVPVLERYHVPLVFAGHNHVYERFVPLRGGEPAADGVVYVTTGGGGARSYGIGDSPLVAVAEETYHFVKVEANRCRLTLKAVDKSGDVFDRYSLTRCP